LKADESSKKSGSSSGKKKGSKAIADKSAAEEEQEPEGPTKKDIHYQRQDIADKALISAIKTLAQL